MGTCSTKVHIISPPTITTYASAAGVRGYNLVIATALALAESSGNQYAKDCDSNGTVDYGLWQINSIHGYDLERLLNDPMYNAAAMYSVSNHGKSWTPWVTYNNGEYKKFLGTASKAQGQRTFPLPKGYETNPKVFPQMGGTPQPENPKENPHKPGEGTIFNIPGLQQLDEFFHLLMKPFEIIKKGVEWLDKKENWIRIFEVIAGGVLLAIAVKELFNIEPPSVAPVPVPV